MAKPKIKIHLAEMSEEMQQDALQFAFLAFNLCEEHSDIADYIKMQFEKRQGGTWNCIVGNCALSVTHKPNGYIKLFFGDTKIIVFRSA